MYVPYNVSRAAIPFDNELCCCQGYILVSVSIAVAIIIVAVVVNVGAPVKVIRVSRTLSFFIYTISLFLYSFILFCFYCLYLYLFFSYILWGLLIVFKLVLLLLLTFNVYLE